MEGGKSENEIFLEGALFHLYLIKLGPFNNLKVRQKEGRSLSITYLRQERTLWILKQVGELVFIFFKYLFIYYV